MLCVNGTFVNGIEAFQGQCVLSVDHKSISMSVTLKSMSAKQLNVYMYIGYPQTF